mmetsp:Transcript_29525/g.68086  ORF Transcript_29525/g.68086 Transcript_29525/m.68086 type:complete len:377 (+) Transcript_29525:196-1326(+)
MELTWEGKMALSSTQLEKMRSSDDIARDTLDGCNTCGIQCCPPTKAAPDCPLEQSNPALQNRGTECLLGPQRKRKRESYGPSHPAGKDGQHGSFWLPVIYSNLQQLCPEIRKRLIADAFTQKQRLALEAWISGQKGVTKHRKLDLAAYQVKDRKGSAGADTNIIPCIGGRVSFHLGYHLYAEVSRSVALRHQCELAAFRSSILMGSSSANKEEFESLVATEAACLPCELTYRTRVGFAREVRMNTPVRGTAVEALRDWRTMSEAWGKEQYSHGHLLSSTTPRLAEEQWQKTLTAWLEIWSQHGLETMRLNKTIQQLTSRRAASWKKLELKWQARQRRIIQDVLRLLYGSEQPGQACQLIHFIEVLGTVEVSSCDQI